MSPSNFPRWKKYLLEFGGTFAICFLGPATVVAGLLLPSPDILSRRFFDALVPGITLAACIATFAKYSGPNVNPAITATFSSAGMMQKRYLAPYVASQLAAGLLAASPSSQSSIPESRPPISAPASSGQESHRSKESPWRSLALPFSAP